MSPDTRAALRLGLTPVLLLYWNIGMGNPLPFLAPSLLVPFLVIGRRPKLGLLAGSFGLMVGLSAAVAALFVALADSPISVWIMLLALAAWAFGRLARNPTDMIANLTLLSASLVVVLVQLAPKLGLLLPWLIGLALAQGIAVVLVAHALLPAAEGEPAMAPPAEPGATSGAVQALGRAAALIAVLLVCRALEDNSAILVAVTAANILAAAPGRSAGLRGQGLLLANGFAALAIVPLLLVGTLRWDPWVLAPLALAGGLWMAGGIRDVGVGRVVARFGLPIYVVLVGTILPEAGGDAVGLLLDRLVTLGVTMLFCLAVLNVLRPMPTPLAAPA